MIYNLANALFIAVGSLVGVLLKKGVPDRIKNSLMSAMGLCVLLIGISLALKGENILLIVISIAIGTLIGEAINLDDKVNKLGNKLQDMFAKSSNEKNAKFSEGFVTASILFCAGAMGVVGSLNVGLTGNGDTLLVKGMIDAVIAALFATAFGISVLFSSVSVFIYQGMFILLASVLSKYLGPEVIASVNGVGGITVIAIGLNLAIGSDIKAANIAPAVFVPMILSIFGIV